MTTNLGTGGTGGHDRYVDVPPRAIEELQKDVAAELLKKLEKVELIEEYCGRFLVEVHAGRDDQQKGEVETEEERLRGHYRDVQALLTVLEGHASGMIGNPDVVRDVQGVLLQKLVALTRNIALLSSSGTFATSSSAWALVRTYLEIWVASRYIARGKERDERESLAKRWKAQQHETAQTTTRLGEAFAEERKWKIDVRNQGSNKPEQVPNHDLPFSDVTAVAFAWVEDTAVPIKQLDVGGFFRFIKNRSAPEWVVVGEPDHNGEIPVAQGGAAVDCRGGEREIGTVKFWKMKDSYGYIKPKPGKGANGDVRVERADLGDGFKDLCRDAEVEFQRRSGSKSTDVVMTVNPTQHSVQRDRPVFVGWINDSPPLSVHLERVNGSRKLVQLLNVAIHNDDIHAASTVDTRNPSVLLYTILPELREAFNGASSPESDEALSAVHDSLYESAMELGYRTKPRPTMPFVIPLPPADAPTPG